MRPLALVAVVRMGGSTAALMLALNGAAVGRMTIFMVFVAALLWGLPLERMIAALIDRRHRSARRRPVIAGTTCFVADPSREAACRGAHLVGVVLRSLR